ncbi:hypothetical protein RclHR1_04320012 [Rhizophagus clarus]|uniref:Uncharacterized protein LOC110856622 n=1 Tax=Rhizophagus clarus TaxID=94130 RepID=A0A2Z6RI87_9GLOM|nr:hypothetical protein RclHR1_04320012 [Rhizophagus clarus]GES97458.1 uncharacterized protein LOC110856622 [Rhizophagus clarus]
MGGSMSIINETNVPLNIALKQITPLYYQNSVKPGETMYKDTGAIHLTVEATIDFGEHTQYSNWSNIINNPINLLSVSSPGWYAGYNHKLAIRGGPEPFIDDANGKRFLQLDNWKPLEIVEI